MVWLFRVYNVRGYPDLVDGVRVAVEYLLPEASVAGIGTRSRARPPVIPGPCGRAFTPRRPRPGLEANW